MPSARIDDAKTLVRLQNRIARLQRRAQLLDRVSNNYWTARRVLFVSGIFLALFLCRYQGTMVALVLTAFGVTVFWAVARKHKTIRDGSNRNSLMIHIKQVQIARINLDWDNLPPFNQELADRAHPFAVDLDITGPRSLHRLVDSAVTREGSHRLKSWLLNIRPDPHVIAERQALVQELRTYSLFRDKLQLHSRLASGNLDGKAGQWDATPLVKWLEHSVTAGSLLNVVRLLGLLASLNLTLVVLAAFGIVPWVWPLVFVAYIGVMIAKQHRIGSAWREVLELEKVLRRFRAVFQYLETTRYQDQPGGIVVVWWELTLHAYSERCRSAFRVDGGRDSELIPRLCTQPALLPRV